MFDSNCPVVSFVVTMMVHGIIVTIPVKGRGLNEEQKALVKRARRGNMVYIEKITVKKPDGTTSEVGNVILKVI